MEGALPEKNLLMALKKPWALFMLSVHLHQGLVVLGLG